MEKTIKNSAEEMCRTRRSTHHKRDILSEFVKSLSDEDIRYIHFHLSERKGGDVAEIVEYLQQIPEIDTALRSALDARNFYDMIDEIYGLVDCEIRQRNR